MKKLDINETRISDGQISCIYNLIKSRVVQQYKVDWFNQNKLHLSMRQGTLIINRLRNNYKLKIKGKRSKLNGV